MEKQINISEKLNYITFLQSFAVLLVVIGHSLPKNRIIGELPFFAAVINKSIYSFHMPLFFCLGGFLLAYSFCKHEVKINFSDFFIKKFKRLIIPYIGIGTVAFMLKTFIFNRFAYRPSEASLLFYIKSMLSPHDNPNIYLWFLPIMFLLLLIGYFFINKKHILPLLCISFVATLFYKSVNIIYLNDILHYLFYFAFGGVLFYYKNFLFPILQNKKSIIFCIFLIGIANSFHLGIATTILALCGILLSWTLALWCEEHNKHFLWGLWDGKYYQIYLLSWFAQTGLRIFYQMNLINYLTCSCIMIIGAFIFSIGLTYITRKYIPIFKIFIGL